LGRATQEWGLIGGVARCGGQHGWDRELRPGGLAGQDYNPSQVTVATLYLSEPQGL
jgi:hypothetical protein